MPDTATYYVLTPLKRNGERIPVGKTLKLTPEDAEPLLAYGAIEPRDTSATRQAGAAEPEQPGGRPASKADRIALIQAAVEQLDAANEDHWRQDGLADTRALESILGWQVSAKERDAADVRRPE